MTYPVEISDEDVRVAFGLVRHALRAVQQERTPGGGEYVGMVEAVAIVEPEHEASVLAAVVLACALAFKFAWPEEGKADFMLDAIQLDWLGR